MVSVASYFEEGNVTHGERNAFENPVLRRQRVGKLNVFQIERLASVFRPFPTILGSFLNCWLEGRYPEIVVGGFVA